MRDGLVAQHGLRAFGSKKEDETDNRAGKAEIERSPVQIRSGPLQESM